MHSEFFVTECQQLYNEDFSIYGRISNHNNISPCAMTNTTLSVNKPCTFAAYYSPKVYRHLFSFTKISDIIDFQPTAKMPVSVSVFRMEGCRFLFCRNHISNFPISTKLSRDWNQSFSTASTVRASSFLAGAATQGNMCHSETKRSVLTE